MSSVPFLNQDDYSHFHNLCAELDSCFSVNNNNAYKRDIFTSLILLEEDEKQQETKTAMESDRDEAMLEHNHKQQAQAIIDYYMQLQDHLRIKRARRSTSTISASAFVSDNVVGYEVPARASSGPSSSDLYHRRLWVKERE